MQTVNGQDVALKAEQGAESSPIFQRADSFLEARAYKQANAEMAKVMKQLNPQEQMRLFSEALELKAKITRRVDKRGWEAAIPIINRAVKLAREHFSLDDLLLASVYQTQSRAYHFSNEFYTARAAIYTRMSLYKNRHKLGFHTL